MYLKKFLNKTNVVESMLIALLFSAGVLFVFGFIRFDVQSAADGEGEALLRMSMSESCAGNKVSCGACEEGNKCNGSKTPSQCHDDCEGQFCGEAGYCDSESAVEYCPNDPDANEYYCEENNEEGKCSNE